MWLITYQDLVATKNLEHSPMTRRKIWGSKFLLQQRHVAWTQLH